MKKTVLSAIGLTVALAFAAPAIAATHTYYVAKVVKTKKCEVTSHKPNGKTVMMIGKGTYKTVSAAKKAMKAAAECKA